MSKKGQSKKNTGKKNEIVIDGWSLYNQLMDEYIFMRELPEILTTGSGYDLSKATLTIHNQH